MSRSASSRGRGSSPESGRPALRRAGGDGGASSSLSAAASASKAAADADGDARPRGDDSAAFDSRSQGSMSP